MKETQEYPRLAQVLLASQATIGRNQGFLSQTQYEQVYGAAEKQSRMLTGLRKSLETQ